MTPRSNDHHGARKERWSSEHGNRRFLSGRPVCGWVPGELEHPADVGDRWFPHGDRPQGGVMRRDAVAPESPRVAEVQIELDGSKRLARDEKQSEIGGPGARAALFDPVGNLMKGRTARTLACMRSPRPILNSVTLFNDVTPPSNRSFSTPVSISRIAGATVPACVATVGRSGWTARGLAFCEPARRAANANEHKAKTVLLFRMLTRRMFDPAVDRRN